MSKIIVITSGKGGVGKTTTAVNLAAALRYFGKDVLIVDGNLSTPNVGIHLNAHTVPVSLNHVLRGIAHPMEAVYEHETGIKVMPASLSIKELKKTRAERLKSFRTDFKRIAPYVIVDCAAGLGNEAVCAIEAADEVIIVTNPELPAITDALKTIKLAEQLKKPVIGGIVTRVQKTESELEPEVVKEMLEVPVIGMVPEDEHVKKSIKEKKPVVHRHPRSKAARAYKEITAKLFNFPYDSKKEREKLFHKIAKWFSFK
ncbi:MAG: septum site-determining protein MinD [Candidatus Pacearchaeota archaeon]|nr:MAG: septum site-determining protein MinD [Candidatus Pacearchaeota archaeon]